MKQLATPPETGLSSEEAAQRLEKYGPNQLTEAPRPSFLALLWDQLNNFVVMMLIVAAFISGIIGWSEFTKTGETAEFIDAGAILAIVVLNSILGIVQERRAEEALAALKKLAAPDAQVLRDGKRQTVPARQLVPGDVLFLETGNFVPADIRLLEAVNLRVEEAALTGESVPVQKDANIHLEANVPLGDRKNTAFMGTLVSYGRGRGVVTSTGMFTQIGLIAKMLQSVEEEETPLQRRLDQLGKMLGWGALAVCALVFAVGWLRGNDPLEMFMLAVGLAIAAVPEGLPAVVTISLALGMREMIQRHALIRRLSSVETLGSTTTICSDKTGTLTQNEMTVTRLWVDGKFLTVTGKGHTLSGDFLEGDRKVDLVNYQAAMTAMWVGALNNDAEMEISGASGEEMTYRMVGDPTEGALLVAAAKAGALPRPLNQAYPRVEEVPFDSERKRMITVHHIKDPKPEDISPFDEQKRYTGYVVAVKGAPDLVLDLCSEYQRLDDTHTALDDRQRMNILSGQ